MNDSILIKPAESIGYGICPDCGKPLYIMEKETNWYSLNNEGHPIKNLLTHGKTIAMCECGREFEYMRDGMKFRPFIPHEIFIREEAIQNPRGNLYVSRETMDSYNENPFEAYNK